MPINENIDTVVKIFIPLLYEPKFLAYNFKILHVALISIVFSIDHCIMVFKECVHVTFLGDLPATIDYTRFDQDPGEHNFSIITTSTFGDLANYSYSFTIPGK